MRSTLDAMLQVLDELDIEVLQIRATTDVPLKPERDFRCNSGEIKGFGGGRGVCV